MTEKTHSASAELAASRAYLEANIAAVSPEDATVTWIEAGGVPVLRIDPVVESTSGTLIHFHGGGYRQGSPEVFAAQLARIAKAIAATVYAVQYPLAPESPFPAALDAAVSAYSGLTAAGVSPQHTVVWGDSAGGGLAAALLLRLRAENIVPPAGAMLVSPWLDLRVVADSYAANAATDQLFSAEGASAAALDYLDGHDPSDPYVSPVLGDWTGQPPLLLLVSDIEVLRDDSVALARAADDAGAAVQLEVFGETQHIWPMMDFPRTEDAVRAVEIMTGFVGRVTARAPH